jgi:hypothetical protein
MTSPDPSDAKPRRIIVYATAEGELVGKRKLLLRIMPQQQ